MIRLFKRITVAALAVATLSCLAACAQWDTPYETYGKEGYNVSVRFDAGDGQFANVNDVYIVDMFKYEDFEQNASGNYEIPLIAPDDSRRGNITYSASRDGYFLAGWYSHRELRFDGDGNMLDDYGNVTLDPEAQGYTYSGRWDFNNGVLEVDPDENPTASEAYVTLYAAWVPYFSFETYVEGESTPYSTSTGLSVSLPGWKNGAMNMNSFFPEREGYTFDGAYSDPECTVPFTSNITGEIDYSTGVSLTPTVKIYTKWREGTWFRVESSEHFTGNISASGNYELFCDIDYTGKAWPKAFSGGTFTGTIIGNGHKITGITVTQPNTKDTQGGIFRAIGSAARITDVIFENVTYNLTVGSILPDAAFGTFASEIEDGATLSGVTLYGTFNIKNQRGFKVLADAQLGLVTSGGRYEGITDEVVCNFVSRDGVSTPASEIDGLLNDDGTINIAVLLELL